MSTTDEQRLRDALIAIHGVATTPTAGHDKHAGMQSIAVLCQRVLASPPTPSPEISEPASEKRMICQDYRVILKHGDCLKLWETSAEDDEGGVYLENVIEGTSVLMTYEEAREVIQVLTEILESE